MGVLPRLTHTAMRQSQLLPYRERTIRSATGMRNSLRLMRSGAGYAPQKAPGCRTMPGVALLGVRSSGLD
jgi:hypothetical protein